MGVRFELDTLTMADDHWANTVQKAQCCHNIYQAFLIAGSGLEPIPF